MLKTTYMETTPSEGNDENVHQMKYVWYEYQKSVRNKRFHYELSSATKSYQYFAARHNRPPSISSNFRQLRRKGEKRYETL